MSNAPTAHDVSLVKAIHALEMAAANAKAENAEAMLFATIALVVVGALQVIAAGIGVWVTVSQNNLTRKAASAALLAEREKAAGVLRNKLLFLSRLAAKCSLDYFGPRSFMIVTDSTIRNFNISLVAMEAVVKSLGSNEQNKDDVWRVLNVEAAFLQLKVSFEQDRANTGLVIERLAALEQSIRTALNHAATPTENAASD